MTENNRKDMEDAILHGLNSPANPNAYWGRAAEANAIEFTQGKKGFHKVYSYTILNKAYIECGVEDSRAELKSMFKSRYDIFDGTFNECYSHIQDDALPVFVGLHEEAMPEYPKCLTVDGAVFNLEAGKLYDPWFREIDLLRNSSSRNYKSVEISEIKNYMSFSDTKLILWKISTTVDKSPIIIYLFKKKD